MNGRYGIAGALSFALLLISSCTDMGSDLAKAPVVIEPDQEGILYDVAGVAGQPGAGGNGGDALTGHLAFPQDVAIRYNGDVLIVDAENHCVRLVSSDGSLSRHIGTGNPGDGSGGRPGEIDLEEPASITVGPTGELWVAAWRNNKIKRIDPQGLTVTVPIGTAAGFGGDGGPAGYAQLDLPSSVVFDEQGNMYISDQQNQRIRKVDRDLTITSFVGSGLKGYADGNGEDASFSFPAGPGAVPGGRISWAHHPDGLLIADSENHRIRFVNLETREVYTVAGTGTPGYSGDDGLARDAQLNFPTDVWMSDDHEIFIADSRNHVIRMINAVGNIVTVAGTGVRGSSPNGTLALDSRLDSPSGICFDESKRVLYIADTGNHQVKKVKLPR